MQIKIEDITSGKMTGEKVWICDYRKTDLSIINAARNVLPVQVLIQDNSLSKKTIYYSSCHFVVLKNDKLTKTIHAPFDNTGYKSRTGNPVYVFDNREECVLKYVELLNGVMARLEDYKKAVVTDCDNKISEFTNIIDKLIKS